MKNRTRITAALLLTATLFFGAGLAAGPFVDIANVPWAQAAIMWNADNAIMIGDGTHFRPADNMTRAELATVNYRMYLHMQQEMSLMRESIMQEMQELEEQMMDEIERIQQEEDEGTLNQAMSNENFSNWLSALNASDWGQDFLGTQGSYTLFLPNDEAFEDVDEDTRDSWLEEENEDELDDLLQYHIVPGRFNVSDLQEGMTLTTVQGDELEVTVDNDGTVRINGAAISEEESEFDIPGGNSVVHTIDTVLMPDNNN